MDYSLVVGVDSVKQELVVGIVGQFQRICSISLSLLTYCLAPNRLHPHLHLG
jgi:hypothetical protein